MARVFASTSVWGAVGSLLLAVVTSSIFILPLSEQVVAASSEEEARRMQIEAQRRAIQRARQRAAQARRARELARRKAMQARQAARRAADRARRQAQEQARRAQAEAKRAAHKAQQEAKRAARKAQQEAKRAARKAQQEAKRAARKAQQEAKRAARKAQQEAKRAARKAQQEAKKAAAKAQREAKKAAAKAQREAKKAAAKAKRSAQSTAPKPSKAPAPAARPAPAPVAQVKSPPRAAPPPSANVPPTQQVQPGVAVRPMPSTRGADTRNVVPDATQVRVGKKQRRKEKQRANQDAANVAVTTTSPTPTATTTTTTSSVPLRTPEELNPRAALQAAAQARPESALWSSGETGGASSAVTAPSAPVPTLLPTPVAPRPAPAAAAAPVVATSSVPEPSSDVSQPTVAAQTFWNSVPPEQQLIATGLEASDVDQAADLGVQVSATSPTPGGGDVRRVTLPKGKSRNNALAYLNRQMPLTRYRPNHTHKIFTGQRGDERLREKTYGLFGKQLIAWRNNLQSCTRKVRIGIIDTSFDTTHPVFKNTEAYFGDFLDGEIPSSHDWHGTAVLSLLAGDPSSDVPGLIPNASFFLAAAFKSEPDGTASTDTVRLLRALQWLESLGVQYINMSFSGPRDELLESAIKDMQKKGVVFIAAAGNQGPTAPPSYPAAYPGVIAVTAINRQGNNYRYANRGDFIDVAAPGVNILTALPGGKTGLRTGTSFAAPFMTAIVATRLAGGGLGGGADAGVIDQIALKDLGPPGRDPIYGRGLALAPKSCTGDGPAVADSAPAKGDTVPVSEASLTSNPWAFRTTLTSAGQSSNKGAQFGLMSVGAKSGWAASSGR